MSWFVESSSFPPRVGNLCEPLINGKTYFDRLRAELKNSSSFWIALSFCNEEFVFELIRFAESVGVQEVLILAWKPLPNPLFSGFLTEESVRQQKFKSLHVRWTESAPDKQHCHHEKSFILDRGRVVFTGGLIASSTWCNKNKMQDCGIVMRGPAAVDVADAFSQRWRLNPEPFLELHRPLEEGPSRCQVQEKKNFSNFFFTSKKVTRSLRPGLLTREGEASILSMWVNAIFKARHLIVIEQQHLAHAGLVSALLDAVKRGVKVVYIRPGLEQAKLGAQKPTLDRSWLGRTRPEYEHVFLHLLPLFEPFQSSFCLVGHKTAHVHSKYGFLFFCSYFFFLPFFAN